MKVVLLGGSNSVKNYGLRNGLLDTDIELIDLSLGATSSLQNLNSIVENYELIQKADLVISESNINDSFNAINLNIGFEQILGNIDRYYEKLSEVNTNVCILLLPINNVMKPKEAITTFPKVNARHLYNIEKYGFDFINLVELVDVFLTKNKKFTNINMLVPDPRHPKTILMYDIGFNIINYYSNHDLKHSEYIMDKLDYYSFKVSEISKELTERSNSRFSTKILRIDKEYFIPKKYIGYRIIGISTWGEGCIKLSNNQEVIVKNFNDLFSFNEIAADFTVDENTCIENAFENITENSINCMSRKPLEGYVGLSSMLMLHPEHHSENPLRQKIARGNNLGFLVHNLLKYAADTEYILEKLCTKADDTDISKNSKKVDDNINRVFKQIKSDIAASDEGTIKIDGLGKFIVRQTDKSGEIVKRVIFRPAK